MIIVVGEGAMKVQNLGNAGTALEVEKESLSFNKLQKQPFLLAQLRPSESAMNLEVGAVRKENVS
jgi:hypothetical protein